MPVRKRTSDITWGNLTTIQMALSGANQFSDTLTTDDISGVGTGPFLVFDRGIWKYPQHTAGGRLEIPRSVGKPIRLTNFMADFGAAASYEIHVAGYDGTGNRPDDTSSVVYPAADAARYREGNFLVKSGAATRYLAMNLDPQDSGDAVLIHPGQHLYLVTVAASAPIVRMTFSVAVENVG
jgi:hypothetical protein